MKEWPDSASPWRRRLHFDDAEFDEMMDDHRRRAGVTAITSREGINVDRVLLSGCKIEADYVDLPTGVLGRTCFRPDGTVHIEISRVLAEAAEMIPLLDGGSGALWPMSAVISAATAASSVVTGKHCRSFRIASAKPSAGTPRSSADKRRSVRCAIRATGGSTKPIAAWHACYYRAACSATRHGSCYINVASVRLRKRSVRAEARRS